MRPTIVFILFALFSSFIPASAAGNVAIDLNGVAFGNNSNDVNRTSAPAVLTAANSYRFRISGKVKGTGDLVSTIPTATPIGNFLDRLEPGFSSRLSGTLNNPSGDFPLTIVSKSFNTELQINTFTRRRFIFDFKAEVNAAGSVLFSISNVAVTSNGFPVPGEIVFEPSSSLTISIPPMVECKFAAVNVDEDFGFLQLSVVRSVNLAGAASVSYFTTEGTAKNGGHFTAKAGKVSFANGESEKFVLIPIIPNTTVGSNKVFSVTLEKPGDGARLGAITQTAITILNNDTGPAPTVNFGAASFSGVEGTTATVQLVRSGDVTSPIKVRVDTAAGSALAGRHFKTLSQVVSFAQGQATQSVTVKLFGNSIEEASRKFFCDLALPSIDVLFGAQSRTEVNILEDDIKVPSALKGPYVALLEPAAFSIEDSGFVSVSVSPVGIYTARLKFGGKSFAVRGKFSTGGIAQPVQFAKNPNRFLQLTIDITGNGAIYGTVRDDGSDIANITAARTPFSTVAKFTLPGKYPFALIPPAGDAADQPTGYGFGYATLGKTGKVKVVGRLADDTPFSFSTLLFQSEDLQSQFSPVYAALYKTYGNISGSMRFNDSQAVSADLRWVKEQAPLSPRPDKIYPGGFDLDLTAEGSVPTLPANGELLLPGDALLSLSGGNLALPLDVPVLIDLRNKVTADEPNTSTVKLKMNGKTRLLSGSFRDGATQLKFKGIVLPDTLQGYGFFIGKPVEGTPVQAGVVVLSVLL